MRSNYTEKYMDIDHGRYYIKDCLKSYYALDLSRLKLFHFPKRRIRWRFGK